MTITPLPKPQRLFVLIAASAVFTFITGVWTLLGAPHPDNKEWRILVSPIGTFPNIMVLITAGLTFWIARRQLSGMPAIHCYFDDPRTGELALSAWPSAVLVFYAVGVDNAIVKLFLPGVVAAALFVWELHHPRPIDPSPSHNQPKEPYLFASPNAAVFLGRLLTKLFWGSIATVSAFICMVASLATLLGLMVSGGELWRDFRVSSISLWVLTIAPLVSVASYKLMTFVENRPLNGVKQKSRPIPIRVNPVSASLPPISSPPFHDPFA